jgi:hypothetical protein
MKNTQHATHNHKRAGAAVLLESTAELGKVLILESGDEFWVQLTDLTELVDGVINKSELGKKGLGKTRPSASTNSPHRVGRAAAHTFIRT